MKKINFVERNLHLIVGTTQYCYTQQTKHKHNKQYTTQNTKLFYNRLVRHQPSSPSCRRSRPWDRRSRSRSRRRLVPARLCRHPPLLKSFQPSFQHGGRRLYTDLRPHTLPHHSPPSRYQPSPPSRRWLSPPRRTLSPPPRRTLSPPPLPQFSSTYHLFNVLHIRHVGRKIAQCSPNKDGGRRFEYTAKTGHFEKSLHLTRTLDARCLNAKFVHKNSLFHGNNYFSAAVLSVFL